MIKILFLAANPMDTNTLRLGEEVRAIQEKLRAAEHREGFKIEQEWAVRVSDIQGHLLRHMPYIVHFSGHGSVAGEIILEDRAGNSKPVAPLALKELFSILMDNIRCVVLNACFSNMQAEAIAESIDFVVGMSATVGDEAAIAFAASFYQALGFGRSIQTSFQLGCNQIDLARLGEANTPVLLTRKGADPAEEFLLKHLKKAPIDRDRLSPDPLDKARQLEATGKIIEAIHLLEATVRDEPGRALIHYNLGVLHQKLGQRDEAVSQYRRATELEDPTGDAYYNLGLLYYEADLLKDAVRELNMAVRINPKHTEAMKAIGILEDKKGNSDSAIKWFLKALKLHPQDAQALNSLAESLKNVGRPDEALNRIRKARKLEPFNRTFQITEQEIEESLGGAEQ